MDQAPSEALYMQRLFLIFITMLLPSLYNEKPGAQGGENVLATNDEIPTQANLD